MYERDGHTDTAWREICRACRALRGKNHSSAPQPGNTDWNQNAGMFNRNQWGTSISWNGIWLKYGQQPAELHWSCKRDINPFDYGIWYQWRDCFIACLKANSKHFKHLLWCVSLWYVTVMTFKAYTTAVMNKLTYVSFHKVGWEQPSGEVVNFVAVLLQTYYSICVPKIMKILQVWQSYFKNNKGAIFCLTVVVLK